MRELFGRLARALKFEVRLFLLLLCVSAI
ncbi:MAG: hypothetical protein H6R07_1, partial [Proteobacteria bacterium]|nr:hypothetical protein [Pseudomonadota bacterium]